MYLFCWPISYCRRPSRSPLFVFLSKVVPGLSMGTIRRKSVNRLAVSGADPVVGGFGCCHLADAASYWSLWWMTARWVVATDSKAEHSVCLADLPRPSMANYLTWLAPAVVTRSVAAQWYIVTPVIRTATTRYRRGGDSDMWHRHDPAHRKGSFGGATKWHVPLRTSQGWIPRVPSSGPLGATQVRVLPKKKKQHYWSIDSNLPVHSTL